MASRLTDTDKWKDTWFGSLSPHSKLLFNFLCDNCDNAGFYEYNKKLMLFLIGFNDKELDEAVKGLAKNYVKSKDLNRIWIKNFLKHQKKLPLTVNNNNHKQIIMLLKNNLDDPKKFGGNKDMANLLPPAATAPAKKKKQSVLPEFVKPTVDQIKAYMQLNEFDQADTEAKRFYNYFNKLDWRVGKNKLKIYNWKSAVDAWLDNYYQRNNQTSKKIDNVRQATENMAGVDWNTFYADVPADELL